MPENLPPVSLALKRFFFIIGIILINFSSLTSKANADLLFKGYWENYLGKFYGPTGWKNGIPQGHLTKDKDWYDIEAFWSPAPVANTWLYNMSWGRDRIRLETDPTSPLHGLVARFEVRGGDYRDASHSGERSEMYSMLDNNRKQLPVSASDGHEFYGISVKLSPDWKPPQHEPTAKGNSLWGTFMQLHSPNVYNSPPAIDLMAESDFHLDWNVGNLDKIIVDKKSGVQKHVKNDSFALNFTDGSLHAGHWVQFILDVTWATDLKGSIAVYRRDEGRNDFKKVLDLKNTPTLQTYSYLATDLAHCPSCAPVNLTHYWRVGYYRSTSNNQTNVLWLGPIVRGQSFDEVAVAAFGSTGQHY